MLGFSGGQIRVYEGNERIELGEGGIEEEKWRGKPE